MRSGNERGEYGVPRNPEVVIGPSIAYLPLTKGLYALIDREDANSLIGTKWHAAKYCNGFYAIRNIPGRKTELLHRFLMSPCSGLLVDHKNMHTLDCRRANMRLATHSQNRVNSKGHRNRRGDYKGVTFDNVRGQYVARISFARKTHNLGRFDSEDAAAAAYASKALELHGEFLRLG